MTETRGEPAQVSLSVPAPRSSVDPVDAQALLALAFENSPVGMTLAELGPSPPSPDGPRPRAIMINRAFAEMLGYPVAELLASTDQGRYTHEADRAADVLRLEGLLAGRDQAAHWDKRYLHADGHIVWARVSVSVLRAADGAPRYVIAQVEDITERRALEVQLLERAERDALTGLLNRSAFEEHAEEQLERCARYGEQAAMLLLDVDELKGINDRHGHGVGDRALVAVADVLRERLRSGDVAARIGGDEFVALLPHANPDEARQIAEDLVATMATTPVENGPADLVIGVSIGTAEMTQRTQSIERALAEADRAMYAMKRRNRSES